MKRLLFLLFASIATAQLPPTKPVVIGAPAVTVTTPTGIPGPLDPPAGVVVAPDHEPHILVLPPGWGSSAVGILTVPAPYYSYGNGPVAVVSPYYSYGGPGTTASVASTLPEAYSQYINLSPDGHYNRSLGYNGTVQIIEMSTAGLTLQVTQPSNMSYATFPSTPVPDIVWREYYVVRNGKLWLDRIEVQHVTPPTEPTIEWIDVK